MKTSASPARSLSSPPDDRRDRFSAPVACPRRRPREGRGQQEAQPRRSLHGVEQVPRSDRHGRRSRQEASQGSRRHVPNLGVAEFGAHDYPAAEAALEEAIRLDPRKSDVYNYLGAVEFSLGEEAKKRGDTAEAKARYDRALESYRKAISDPLFQNRQQVYLSIADVHDSMGDAEAALRSAREAIEVDPRYYAAHFKVAVLLDRLERTREAIEEYEIAAPGFASDTNYHYRLGVAYFRDRKPDLARDHLAMVVAAAPGTEKARKAKEFLDLMGAPAPPRRAAGRPPFG